MQTRKDLFQDPVDEISSAYRASQVLLTANRLGLFTALADGGMSLDQLVEALGTHPRGTRILCDALVALSLLEKSDGVYRNSPLAVEYLTPQSPRSKIAILHHSARLYETWGKLYDCVKNGRPVPQEVIDARLQWDERDFALAMADVARSSAGETADKLDFSGVKKMLDVGGGPGVYAIEFVRRNPGLQAVILDNEETLQVAKANIDQAGLSDRVSLRAGDALKDDLGTGYDFVLLSNVVHAYPSEDNKVLVARCAQALVPGGRLCIKDFFLDPSRASPAYCALFAVNMLVNTEGGDCYTVEQAREWLRDAGLELGDVVDVVAHSRLVIGIRPVT